MAQDRTKIINTRLGEREVAEDKVIRFPRGVIGFDGQREFTLLQIKEESPFLLLQSMADADLGFLVADPFSFMPAYEVKIGPTEEKILEAPSPDQIALLVTVTIPRGQPENTTLNLLGPIVVNTKAMVGLQVPQVDARYPARYQPYLDGVLDLGQPETPGAAEDGDPEAGTAPEG